MDDRRSICLNRPFERLQKLLAQKGVALAEAPAASTKQTGNKEITDPRDERTAFMEAMADVTPLKHNRIPAIQKKYSPGDRVENKASGETLRKLRELISTGRGFVVSQTPEYIEGAIGGSKPDLTSRLHRGVFAVQDYVDLHGLHARDAKEVFEDFIKRSIAEGKKAVLVVHGRGLSSPNRPVLKSSLVSWMTKNPWRKWISAYTSARLCDGGAGATYILLREKPRKKRRQKKFPAIQ